MYTLKLENIKMNIGVWNTLHRVLDLDTSNEGISSAFESFYKVHL